MSRNQNSHFSLAPHANIPRSRFDMSHSMKCTGNAGYAIPFEIKEVLPGDSFTVNTSMLARMQTLIVPLMDDMYADIFWFYVPNRLLWKNWEHFCGESDEPWFDEDANYSVPGITVDVAPGALAQTSATDHVIKGTVADYLGLPLARPLEAGESYTKATVTLNALPFRAYVKCCNDWIRDENTTPLYAFNTEDNNVTLNNSGEAFYGGSLIPVNKYRDYFTSCLPLPQRGEPVVINPLEINFTGQLGVVASSTEWNKDSDAPLSFYTSNSSYSNMGATMVAIPSSSGDFAHYYARSQNSGSQLSGNQDLFPANLVAIASGSTSDLTGNVSPISINDLRMAFATQRYLEALARSGSRYIEMLEGIFGVTAPDARLQRAEFLGGNRVQININQAVQNSETGTTPLGNIGAYSLTTDSQFSFEKSFVEHGWILGIVCVRYDHSYQDGIERFWSRRDFLDFYNPYLANIGEQPVYNKEIYIDGSSDDDEVFGYQEAWADYRYANNRVAGEMRSRYSSSLDYWHLADNYDSLPYLDDEWRVEDGETIDRAIAVSQRLADQFLFDFYIDMKVTRPMPLFSVPGLDVL